MKRILFVLLMMICSVSWAEWIVHGIGDDFTLYLHDKQTIERKGSIAKMWVMYSYDSPQNSNNEIYQSSVHLDEYNCKEKTVKIVQQVLYFGKYGKGKVIESISIKQSVANEQHIIPGSFGDRQLKLACGKPCDDCKALEKIKFGD